MVSMMINSNKPIFFLSSELLSAVDVVCLFFIDLILVLLSKSGGGISNSVWIILFLIWRR